MRNIGTIEIKTIYQLLDLIQLRTPIFIGDNNLSTLNGFILGYCSAHNQLEQEFPPFWYFHEWVRLKYGWSSSVAGWKNILLEENNFDERKALQMFFELLQEFKSLEFINIQEAKITTTEKDFHFSEQCKIKTIKNGDFEAEYPVFTNSYKIYLVEYSNQFGFANFVIEEPNRNNTEWKYLYTSEKLAKESMEELFGNTLIWQTVNGNFDVIKQEIISSL